MHVGKYIFERQTLQTVTKKAEFELKSGLHVKIGKQKKEYIKDKIIRKGIKEFCDRKTNMGSRSASLIRQVKFHTFSNKHGVVNSTST